MKVAFRHSQNLICNNKTKTIWKIIYLTSFSSLHSLNYNIIRWKRLYKMVLFCCLFIVLIKIREHVEKNNFTSLFHLWVSFICKVVIVYYINFVQQQIKWHILRNIICCGCTKTLCIIKTPYIHTRDSFLYLLINVDHS